MNDDYDVAFGFGAIITFLICTILAGLLSGCVQECPTGQELRWTPEPPRDKMVACSTTMSDFFYCMQNLGYRRVCR